MPSISRQFILFITLSFALAAQAVQDDERETKIELASPSVVMNFSDHQSRQSKIDSYKNINRKFKELESNQRSNRYGVGYEIRQGERSSTPSSGYGRSRTH